MIQRIALIKPCCIGDVIFATPLLSALQRGYPEAQIEWIVSSSAIGAIRNHPALARAVDCGPLANPASRPASFLNLGRLLRAGKYDLAVVPDRSPLIGLAVLLSGIARRVGLDSAGRGFAYTVRARIDPGEVRHEAEIYLDLARALGLSTEGCIVNVPPSAQALESTQAILQRNRVDLRDPRKVIVVHPGGAVNVGMTMLQKRWPAGNYAALADRAADHINGQIAVIGIKSDQEAIERFKQSARHPVTDLSNQLSLAEIGALASLAAVYLGNDNGVAHLAAASGGKVLMIFGPSDPRRYAPFVPPDRARIAWRPVTLPERGVSAGGPADFDWQRDGVSVDEAWDSLLPLLAVAD